MNKRCFGKQAWVLAVAVAVAVMGGAPRAIAGDSVGGTLPVPLPQPLPVPAPEDSRIFTDLNVPVGVQVDEPDMDTVMRDSENGLSAGAGAQVISNNQPTRVLVAVEYHGFRTTEDSRQSVRFFWVSVTAGLSPAGSANPLQSLDFKVVPFRLEERSEYARQGKAINMDMDFGTVIGGRDLSIGLDKWVSIRAITWGFRFGWGKPALGSFLDVAFGVMGLAYEQFLAKDQVNSVSGAAVTAVHGSLDAGFTAKISGAAIFKATVAHGEIELDVGDYTTYRTKLWSELAVVFRDKQSLRPIFSVFGRGGYTATGLSAGNPDGLWDNLNYTYVQFGVRVNY